MSNNSRADTIREQTYQAHDPRELWYREYVKIEQELATALYERNAERRLRELGWSSLECPMCDSSLAGKMENYATMKAERDSAMKDANRYRMLREAEDINVYIFRDYGREYLDDPKDLDAFIDGKMDAY